MMWLLLAVLSLQRPVPAPPALPPSTLEPTIYVAAPVTIEVANMSAQMVADLVAAKRIALDEARHLGLPTPPATLSAERFAPRVQLSDPPPTAADRPYRGRAPLVVRAPARFAIVGTAPLALSVRGNRLVITEIK
jgi:hypothetical protein